MAVYHAVFRRRFSQAGRVEVAFGLASKCCVFAVAECDRKERNAQSG